MKRIIQLIILLIFTTTTLTIVAQTTTAGSVTPAGAGDKNLADNGIKLRSVELERIKREAERAEAASFAPINTEINSRFPQIKEDFEGIQILEAAIIKAYTTGKTIDYGLIESSADGINKRCRRLDLNLFAESKKDKNSEDKSEKAEKPKSLKDLIILLDTAIGDFVTSPLFGKVKVVEPATAIKTRTDLLNVLKLSERIGLEAKRLKS